MYFSFASKDKGSCNVSTCKFIRFPLNSYTFHALIRFYAPILQETDDFPSFYTYLPLEQVTTLHIFAKKVIHFYKRLQTYEKHLIAWGILSTMFMANTLPRKTSTVLLWDGVHGTPIM